MHHLANRVTISRRRNQASSGQLHQSIPVSIHHTAHQAHLRLPKLAVGFDEWDRMRARLELDFEEAARRGEFGMKRKRSMNFLGAPNLR